MITQIENTPENVVALTCAGTITADEIEQIGEVLDTKIKQHEKISVLVDMTAFEDMTAGAVIEDIKMESSFLLKLKNFAKAAIVTDKNWLKNTAKMAAKLAPNTELKSFGSGELDQALAFVSQIDHPETIPASPAVTDIPTGSPTIVAAEISGKIDEESFKPLAEKIRTAIEQHGDINLMLTLNDFSGYDISLLSKKSLFDLKKEAIKHVKKYAIVNPKPWMTPLIKLVDPLFKMDIQTFEKHEQDKALTWLKS